MKNKDGNNKNMKMNERNDTRRPNTHTQTHRSAQTNTQLTGVHNFPLICTLQSAREGAIWKDRDVCESV